MLHIAEDPLTPLHTRYADDLKLLSPDLKGVQRLLNICKQLSSCNGLIVNATKTLCIQLHYGKHSGEIILCPIYLTGLGKLQ